MVLVGVPLDASDPIEFGPELALARGFAQELEGALDGLVEDHVADEARSRA